MVPATPQPSICRPMPAIPCGALKVTVTRPKSRPRSAPIPRARASPSQGGPGEWPSARASQGGRKARKAPMLMIPSQPRLKTPARWLKFSPRAARSSATEKGTPRASTSCRNWTPLMARPPSPSLAEEAPAARRVEGALPGVRVGDDHAGRDDGQDDDALEHQHHVGRHAGRALGHVGADEEQAEEDRGRDDAGRVEAAEERHHDAGEAVAAGDGLDGPVVDAGHLDRAGQPGEAAGQHHGRDQGALHVDAGVAGRLGLGAGGAQPVAEGGAPEHEPGQEGQDQGQHEAGVEPVAR